MLPATLQFIIAMIACAINERMQRKPDYAQAEGQVLTEILAAITGSGRISFTADQRRRLAVAGERYLRHLIKEFVERYVTEPFHQGIGGQLIRNAHPRNDNGADGKVARRSRLGGLLKYCCREAA